MLVDEDNVRDLPLAAGFALHGNSLMILRPVRFATGGLHESGLVVCDEFGAVTEVNLDQVPNMRSYEDLSPGVYRLGQVALLRHRKGGATEPEDRYRVLRIAGYGDNPDHRPAEIRYGQHPDHPEHAGFYVGAQHIGTATLDLATVEYLPADQVAMKYFPLLSEPFAEA